MCVCVCECDSLCICVCVYKKDLALNNKQGLMCHKTNRKLVNCCFRCLLLMFEIEYHNFPSHKVVLTFVSL